jgi:hypothetical protein
MLGQVMLGIGELETINIRLKVEIERRAGFCDPKRQRSFTHLPRAQQGDGWRLFKHKPEMGSCAALNHPGNYRYLFHDCKEDIDLQ